MRANYNPNRLNSKQIAALKEGVVKEYNKVKSAHERKINDRVFFIHYLSLAIVSEELLGFGAERRARLLQACMNKANELSQELISNKCTDTHGHESYDSEYNRALLERLSKAYGIKFDESIFDDDFEDEEATH